MCDSLDIQPASSQNRCSRSESIHECLHYGENNFNLEAQSGRRNVKQSDRSLLEVSRFGKDAESPRMCVRNSGSYPYRFQLEKDVQRLQLQLQEEIERHDILQNAVDNSVLKLSFPSCLSQIAQDLMSNIALMEVAISKLEQEMVSLHFQLSQERNERRLVEYRLKDSSHQPIFPSEFIDSSPRLLKHMESENHTSDDNACILRRDQPAECSGNFCPESVMEIAVDSAEVLHEKKMNVVADSKTYQSVELKKLPRGLSPKGLWHNPNQLSEEMVRCMKSIFTSLVDSSAIPSKSNVLDSRSSSASPRGHFSTSSWWSSSERSMMSSWVQSPQVDIQSHSEVLATENAFDPYREREKLSWADIGTYGLATEVSWMSVGKQQLEYASGALRRFRNLVEQLGKVNPIHLSYNEKLAFWINLYNALIMHAYLAYGVPKSDLKFFSLMQKAAYTVGGNSFSAAVIEYVILKMKPPMHRPQIALLLALQKLKVMEEQRKSAIDTCEPLVAFAISSGMYSSPAVRIYTAKNIREELLEAQRDFIRASVGVSSKGKLLVPKMLHCFAKGFVEDSNLAVWISHYLPANQAAFVEQCLSRRRQSLLGSRNCGTIPFDTRFRYLFLP
ncbi:hypothetical protein ACFE04_001800 [Oxalis oulophora]